MKRESRYGAPLLGWRMTMASAPSEVTVHPVSMSDSPFSMLEEVAVMSVVVAPESFGGKFERGAGAGGRLVEKQHHALAAQELRRRVGGPCDGPASEWLQFLRR